MTQPVAPTSEIQVQFAWNFSECAQAVRQVMRYRPRPRWWRPMMRIFVAGIVVLLVLAVVGASSDGWSGVITILPWIVILVLWLGLLGGGQAWIGAWHIRRNNRHLVAGQQHSLSDAGYRVRCGLIESTIPWAGFERLVETRDFFLAYPHRSGAYYLPKRSLTAEQTRQARELFKLHGGDRATVLAA